MRRITGRGRINRINGRWKKRRSATRGTRMRKRRKREEGEEDVEGGEGRGEGGNEK